MGQWNESSKGLTPATSPALQGCALLPRAPFDSSHKLPAAPKPSAFHSFPLVIPTTKNSAYSSTFSQSLHLLSQSTSELSVPTNHQLSGVRQRCLDRMRDLSRHPHLLWVFLQ